MPNEDQVDAIKKFLSLKVYINNSLMPARLNSPFLRQAIFFLFKN